MSERGYEDARVADIVEVAGVSRSTFYKHFANKQDCFIATIETICGFGTAAITEVYRSHQGSWYERLEAGLYKLVDMIVEQPAAARLQYLEVHAAGPEAIERAAQIDRYIDELALASIKQAPQYAGAPRYLSDAVFGGFRKIIQRRLREGREHELRALVPELLAWGSTYHRPATDPRQPSAVPGGFLPPRPNPRNPSDRIMVAVTELVVEKGYPAVNVTDIATRASASLSTFYANFRTKEEALLAALDYSIQLILEATLPSYKQTSDWPHAVAAALHASFGYLSLEPIFAHFSGVDIFRGAPGVRERRDGYVVMAQSFLAKGYKLYPDTMPIAAEAIGGSIDTLLYEQVRRNGADRLYEVAPGAIFLVLTPFIGSERAIEIANEDWTPPAVSPEATAIALS
jgi:AcrR family transcriptional regulator